MEPAPGSFPAVLAPPGSALPPPRQRDAAQRDISAAVRTHTNPSSHQLQPSSNANSVANCPDTGDGPDLGAHTTPSSCPVEKTHPAAGLMGDMKGSWAQLGRDVQDSKQKGEFRKRDLATSGTARAGTGNPGAGAWLRCEVLTPAPGWGERRGTGGDSPAMGPGLWFLPPLPTPDTSHQSNSLSTSGLCAGEGKISQQVTSPAHLQLRFSQDTEAHLLLLSSNPCSTTSTSLCFSSSLRNRCSLNHS